MPIDRLYRSHLWLSMLTGWFLVGAAGAGPAGAESQVNAVATGEQTLARVTSTDAGGSVVVFQSNQNGDDDVFARRFDASLLPVGSQSQVNTYTTGFQASADVARAANGNTVFVFEGEGPDDDFGVFARAFDPSWVPLADAFQVNTYTTSFQYAARAGANGNRFTVSWSSQDQDGSGAGVFRIDYDAAFNALNFESQVNTTTAGDQTFPTLYDERPGWVGTAFLMAFWGAVSGGAPEAASGFAGPIPDIDVFGQLYDVDGDPLGGEFQINSYTNDVQANPDVARGPDGSGVVVWDSFGQDGDGSGIFGQRFDANGAAVGGEFQVNTYTTGSQFFATVSTAPNGNSLVVWEGSGQGDTAGIFGQGYDANGNALGGEFQVNTYTTALQSFPDVASQDDSSFVVVWDSFGQDGDGSGIFAEVVTLPEPATWLGLLSTLPVLHALSRRRRS